jgi:hypothetical protein
MAKLSHTTRTEYAFKNNMSVQACVYQTYNYKNKSKPVRTVKYGKTLLVLQDYSSEPYCKAQQMFCRVSPVSNERTAQENGNFVAPKHSTFYFLLDLNRGYFVFRQAVTPQIAHQRCSDAMTVASHTGSTSYIRDITETSLPAIPTGMFIKNQDPKYNDIERAYDYNWQKIISQNVNNIQK